VALIAPRSEHPPDGSCDRADPGPRSRELPARSAQVVQQRFAGSLVLFRKLGQRLDGLARHPAGSVRSILAELGDPVFE
jgi:hypothetical protein